MSNKVKVDPDKVIRVEPNLMSSLSNQDASSIKKERNQMLAIIIIGCSLLCMFLGFFIGRVI